MIWIYTNKIHLGILEALGVEVLLLFDKKSEIVVFLM